MGVVSSACCENDDKKSPEFVEVQSQPCAPSLIEEDPTSLAPLFGSQYKHNVMFLCNHNSCRSQMADGWLRTLRGDASVGVASSGIVGGTAVKPDAVTVMKDAGVDISAYSSDAVADFRPEYFNVVISCCGCGSKLDSEDKAAWKQREVFLDWNLDDPPAIDPGDLSAYRRVRDECKAKVLELLEQLKKERPPIASNGVEVDFIGDDGKPTTRVFSRKPLGFKFTNRKFAAHEVAPIYVSAITAGGHAAELGIKEGWMIIKISGIATKDMTFERTKRLFKEKADHLPQS